METNKVKNVLLLTASIGGGHNAAANALKKYVEDNNKPINLTVVDYLNYVNPALSKLSSFMYENCTKYIPKLYSIMYKINNSTININNFYPGPIFYSKGKKLISEYQPDIVICLHPFIVSELAKLNKNSNYSFGIFVLITDLNFHEGWVYSKNSKYIVSNNYMRLRLLNKGIPDKNIYCYGIPTSNEFKNKVSKIEARKKLSLHNMTTVLLIGGSFGAGKIKDVFKKISKSHLNIQLVVITGRNTGLKNAIKKMSNLYNNPLRILGFTDKMSLFMDAADFLITKPGGLTITEAMIKQLPMIIINPIPGQEEENCRFLLNKGIAVSATDDLISTLSDLIEDEARVKDIKLISSRYAKPSACKNIINTILSY